MSAVPPSFSSHKLVRVGMDTETKHHHILRKKYFRHGHRHEYWKKVKFKTTKFWNNSLYKFYSQVVIYNNENASFVENSLWLSDKVYTEWIKRHSTSFLLPWSGLWDFLLFSELTAELKTLRQEEHYWKHHGNQSYYEGRMLPQTNTYAGMSMVSSK